MTQDLFSFYEAELSALREAGLDFAARYPKIAGRLHLSADEAPDPHVERLIQAFAFLTARVQRRLDDSLVEAVDQLLDSLFPALVRRVPSRTIVRISARPEQQDALSIPRGTEFVTNAIQDPPEMRGFTCRFRSCHDIEVLPAEVRDIRLDQAQGHARSFGGITSDAQLVISLKTAEGVSWSDLDTDRIRFFIDDDSKTASFLYDLIMGRRAAAFARAVPEESAQSYQPKATPIPVDIRPVGFEPDEAILDTDTRSHEGHRLLLEYLTTPEKFLFFDVTGLRPALEGAGSDLEITVLFKCKDRRDAVSWLTRHLSPSSLVMGCTPLVNLFRHQAEPIRVTQNRHSYPVVPDQRRPWGYEVHDVVSATLVERKDGLTKTPAHPLFAQHRAFQDSATARGEDPLYWSLEREIGGDGAPNHHMVLHDRSLSLASRTDSVLLVETVCTNRDFPPRLPADHRRGDFSPAIHSDAVHVRRLRRPMPPVDLGEGPAKRWRLVSQLIANRLALSDGGAEALRGVLDVFVPTDSGANAALTAQIRRQIEAIQELQSQPEVARLGPVGRDATCFGTAVRLGLDPEGFAGGSPFLFCAVLERFIGEYAGINSFTQFSAYDLANGMEIMTWPKRLGTTQLL